MCVFFIFFYIEYLIKNFKNYFQEKILNYIFKNII